MNCIPTVAGLYEMRCGENDNVWEFIKIVERDGTLIAMCPDLGEVILDHYHNG